MLLVTFCMVVFVVIMLIRNTFTGYGISPRWGAVARGGVLSAYGVTGGGKRVVDVAGVSRGEGGVFMSNGTPNTSGEHTANEIFLHHHTIVKKLFGCALGIHDGKTISIANKLKAIANCTNNIIPMVPVLGYSGRGLSYGGIGEYDRAIADFESMMRLNPDDGLAYNYRGIIYGKKDDFDRAISDFDTALTLAPSLGDKVYYLRGLAHLGKGNVDRAIADFTRAIEINLSKTPSAEVYLVRGFVYGGKGDVNSAIADFEAALKIEPDNADAKEFLEKIR